jgi:AAA family ATP:ADP antiporter
MLWLPTSREEKYKAKQAVDTFFVRTGDLISAGIVFVGTSWLAFGVEGFAVTNLVLVLAWLAVAGLLLREHRRVVARSQRAEAA